MPCRAPFGCLKVVIIGLEIALKLKSRFRAAFLSIWGARGAVLGSIFGSFVGACWLPNRAVDRIAKTTKSDDVTALFKVFQVPGGRKSTKNVTESSFEHQPCSKSVLGASWDQFWSHFGSILGSKICSKSKLKIEAIFERY